MPKQIIYRSVAILTCYYGEWPWYFPYFLQSCKYNPSIDFIIITDIKDTIFAKPDNVIIVNKPLREIEITASRKLGFPVNIPASYKLCDFKPAYGFLFPEVLKGYKFWGHGDIDIIYGNIREFITEDILIENELITARHDFLSGTFTLFKNTRKMNMLFMQSKDYKKVFSSTDHFCFDECNFLWKEIGELKKGKTIFDLPCEIESMTHVVMRLKNTGYLKAYFDFLLVEGRPGKLKWRKGSVIYKNKFEALLYHLILFKKKCSPQRVPKQLPDTYYISSNNIYSR